jgi:hypothetical protein
MPQVQGIICEHIVKMLCTLDVFKYYPIYSGNNKITVLTSAKTSENYI